MAELVLSFFSHAGCWIYLKLGLNVYRQGTSFFNPFWVLPTLLAVKMNRHLVWLWEGFLVLICSVHRPHAPYIFIRQTEGTLFNNILCFRSSESKSTCHLTWRFKNLINSYFMIHIKRRNWMKYWVCPYVVTYPRVSSKSVESSTHKHLPFFSDCEI